MTTMNESGCDFCACGDLCGVDENGALAGCPVAMADDGGEPTNRDVMRLITALMAGINQRFAQVMILIDRHHAHHPGGPRWPR